MSLFESADWFQLAPDAQEAAIAQDFARLVQGNANFQSADPATQERYRQAHRQLVEERTYNSQQNPKWAEARDAQITAEYQGTGANLFDKLIGSHSDVVARGALIPGMTQTGPTEMDWATSASKYIEKRNLAPQTEERKQLAADMASWNKSWDHGNGWDKTAASLKLAADIITNPVAILDVAAESAASMSVIGAGGAAGTAVGSGVAAATSGLTAPAIPLFTAAGAFSAEAADAASSKFLEKLETRLRDAGIDPTPTNIKVWMDNNQTVVAQDQKDSMIYGGALGAVDIALGGFFSKLASLPTTMARRAALKAMPAEMTEQLAKVAAREGKSVKELTDAVVNIQASEILRAQSFKSKLGFKGLSYGGEVLSEPASEAVGMVASGEEIKADDLIYETIGGIGAGPYGSAINMAMFGASVPADKAKAFAKELLTSTPESRAQTTALKDEFKATQARAQSQADLDFKKVVAETDVHDEQVINWSNPDHTDFNPAKAIGVLSKAQETDVDALDKATKLSSNTFLDILKTTQKLVDMKAQEKELRDAGEITKADKLKKDQGILEGTLASKRGELNIVNQAFAAMKLKASEAAKAKEVNPVEVGVSTEEEVKTNIIDSLGSAGSGRITRDGLKKITEQPGNHSPELVEAAESILKANVAQENIETLAKSNNAGDASGKTMVDVSEDIYNGPKNADFKGINGYKQAVSLLLGKGDVTGALKQLTGLQEFRDEKIRKAEMSRGIYDTLKAAGWNKSALSKAQNEFIATMDLQSRAMNGKGFYIDGKSHKLIGAMEAEAEALTLEADALNKIIALKKGMPKSTPASTNQAAPAGNAEASAPTPAPAPRDYTKATDEWLAAAIERGSLPGVLDTPEKQETFNQIKAEYNSQARQDARAKAKADAAAAAEADAAAKAAEAAAAPITPPVIETPPAAETPPKKKRKTPAVRKPKPIGRSLIGAIKKLGGINAKSFDDNLDSEYRKGGRALNVVNDKGRGLDDMAAMLIEHGWQIDDDGNGQPDITHLARMIEDELSGDPDRRPMHPDDAELRIGKRPEPIDVGVIEDKIAVLRAKVREWRGRRTPKDTSKLHEKIGKLREELAAAIKHNKQFAPVDWDSDGRGQDQLDENIDDSDGQYVDENDIPDYGDDYFAGLNDDRYVDEQIDSTNQALIDNVVPDPYNEIDDLLVVLADEWRKVLNISEGVELTYADLKAELDQQIQEIKDTMKCIKG